VEKSNVCPGKKYETICGENIVPRVEIHPEAQAEVNATIA
jgi:hypothetical protein